MKVNNLSMILTAMTGDDSKPFLVAICLIISIVLIVVLFITGRMMKDKDEQDVSNDEEDIDDFADDDSDEE